MLSVGRKHVLQVAAADDQQPVEAFAADASYPALGVSARPRRPHRRFDHTDAVGAEDLAKRIEGGWLDFDVAIATPDLM